MAVTLAVTDLQNAGGVSCAVTGTGTITVQYYDNGAWVTLGSRSGSGTVTGTARAGLLWWLASTSTEVSAVVPKALTRNAHAVYDLCLQAIKDTIELARAADVPTMGKLNKTQRQRKLRLDSLESCLPCAVVLPGNPSMEPVTNERDQLTYPCIVTICNSDESIQADDDETVSIPYHLINERIRRLFSQQRLSGVTQVDVCRVQLGNVFEWQQMYDEVQSVVIVNCLAREYRGI